MTLQYADGSTAWYWLGFSDWTLNANGSNPSYGNQIAVKTAYRNYSHSASGRDKVNTCLFPLIRPSR